MGENDHQESKKNIEGARCYMKKFLVVLLCLGIGCATTSKVANRLSLGMSTQEVAKQCGRPYRKEAREGQEVWYYQEEIWLETGYPHLMITEVYFQDGQVVKFQEGDEPARQPHNIQQIQVK